jgi:hypothetical protein
MSPRRGTLKNIVSIGMMGRWPLRSIIGDFSLGARFMAKMPKSRQNIYIIQS